MQRRSADGALRTNDNAHSKQQNDFEYVHSSFATELLVRTNLSASIHSSKTECVTSVQAVAEGLNQ